MRNPAEMTQPMRPTRSPSAGLFVVAALLWLGTGGCATTPTPSAPTAGDEPATVSPRSAFDSQAWSSLSRAGHQAMRPHRYTEAEQSFRHALETTAPLPPHDARIRASLGNLVRVAAAYQRAGRSEEADRVMTLVRDHVREQHRASRAAVRYSDLDRSFVELTRVRPILQRGPRRSRGAQPPVHHGFDPLIRESAHRFGLDPALVKAVVAAESNFQVAAVSHAGAQGLMQLMPSTAREMGVAAPFDPSQNLMGGSRYLRDMIDRYDDVKLALAAYNAGPSAVDRHAGVPPYPETTAYVKRVLHYFEGYRRQTTP